MESLTIVRIWAAAAWADGTLHPAEAAALRRLIEASDDLDPAARQEAFDYLKAAPRQDPVIEAQKMSRAAREGVLRAAHGIVKLDGKITAEEDAFLARLRGLLGLDAATVGKIEGEG